MDVVVKNLVEFKPEKTRRDLNESDVPSTGLVESETFLRGLDVDFVKKCCEILSYQLRLKHPICLTFDAETSLTTEESRMCYSLFWSIDNFSTYIDHCTTFAEVFRDCNERVASLFRDETLSSSSKKRRDDNDENGEEGEDENPNGGGGLLGKRKRSPVIPATMNSNEIQFDDLETILEQYQSMQKIFGAFIDMFLDKNFDRYVIYKRFFLDHTLSDAVPLTLSAETFQDLSTFFASLLRFTVQSTDYCNTQMSAFFGPGMMINMLLYLTSSDIVNDAVAMVSEHKEIKLASARAEKDGASSSLERRLSEDGEGRASDTPSPTLTKPPLVTHWTRLTIRDRDDYDSAFLLRDIDNDEYRRCVASLSPDEFSPEMGHVFMSKGDTLSTLFLQFVSRLYRRLLEWPERGDVKTHLERFYQCDNIATFFAQSGRQSQTWIRFFKRRPKDSSASSSSTIPSSTSVGNADDETKSDDSPSQPRTDGFVTSFASSTSQHSHSSNEISDRKRAQPLVYINIERLHALYDFLSHGLPQSAAQGSNKRPRLDGLTSGGGSASGSSAAPMKLVAQNASVKATWDSLNEFKRAYVDFFVKGCSRDEFYRRWFVSASTDFVLRSGGFRPRNCRAEHSRDIEMSFEDGYIRYRDCKECTYSLYRCPDLEKNKNRDVKRIDLSESIFTFKNWADEVNSTLFPYNFLLSSVAYVNNGRAFDDTILRQVWILKAQEILVTRKFTSEKCRRCLEYFEKLERVSRFVVEESNLKKIFAALLRDLPFLQDFFNVEDDAENSDFDSAKQEGDEEDDSRMDWE